MLLLHTLAPQSFTFTFLLSCGCVPVQHPGMSKAMHIKGVGGSTGDTRSYLVHCPRPLFKGTNQSIPLQCSLCQCEADSRLLFKMGARSLLTGRHCSYSLFNSPGQRPSLQCLSLRQMSFSGLKNMPSTEITLLKLRLFREIVFCGHLTAASCLSWLQGFGYCNFFHQQIVPLFTICSSNFFSISYLFSFVNVCLSEQDWTLSVGITVGKYINSFLLMCQSLGCVTQSQWFILILCGRLKYWYT